MLGIHFFFLFIPLYSSLKRVIGKIKCPYGYRRQYKYLLCNDLVSINIYYPRLCTYNIGVYKMSAANQ